MSDVIDQAIEKVDAECPVCDYYGHHLRDSCKGIIHTLVREVAKTAEEVGYQRGVKETEP